jgi:hypothetical protein
MRMSDRPNVFISCTRDNLARAADIAAGLRREGMSAVTDWTDDKTGGDWIGRLEAALDDCDVFVPLVSRAFLASGFATYEVGFALHKHSEGTARIVPVILEDLGGERLPHGLGRFRSLDGREKTSGEIAHAVLAALRETGVEAGALVEARAG